MSAQLESRIHSKPALHQEAGILVGKNSHQGHGIALYYSNKKSTLSIHSLPIHREKDDETLYKKTAKELSAMALERALKPREIIIKKGEGLIWRKDETPPDELRIRIIETQMTLPKDAVLTKDAPQSVQLIRYKRAQELKYLRNKKKLQKYRAEAEQRIPPPREIVIKKGEGLIWRKNETPPDELRIRIIETKFSLPQNAVYKKGLSENEQVHRYKMAQEMKKIRVEKKEKKDEIYGKFLEMAVGYHGFNPENGAIHESILRFRKDIGYFKLHPEIGEMLALKKAKVPLNHPLMIEKQRELEQARLDRERKEAEEKKRREEREKKSERMIYKVMRVFSDWRIRMSLYIDILTHHFITNLPKGHHYESRGEVLNMFFKPFSDQPADYLKGYAFLAAVIAGYNAYEWHEENKRPLDLEKEFAKGNLTIQKGEKELSYASYLKELKNW